MRRLLLLLATLSLVASCGGKPPPPEAPAAVVPNLPIINPARPVTEKTLSSLEADFRQEASKAVVPYIENREEEDTEPLEARIIRLFSKEKVLWMEVRLGPWWDNLDRSRREEVLTRLSRLLYTLDQKAFNQKRDIILTAKDLSGRRLGDATASPFSTNVRLSP